MQPYAQVVEPSKDPGKMVGELANIQGQIDELAEKTAQFQSYQTIFKMTVGGLYKSNTVCCCCCYRYVAA